jgi:uncharacterized membrane protein
MPFRSPIHHQIRTPRRIRSMHGEPWHQRKTIGTNISSEEHQLFKTIAESHGVSVSMYLRALVIDVLVEEAPQVVPEKLPNLKRQFLKTA